MSEQRSWPPPLSEARAVQVKTVVMAEVRRAPAAAAGRHRRRFLAVIATVVEVLLMGAGAAAAYLRFAAPDEPNLGYCSPSVSLDPAVWGQLAFGAVPDVNGNQSAFEAIDACTAMWRAGIVTAPDQTGVPPELTACVVEGSLVVFPDDETVCARLGVPQPRP
jgi:hypothetical protein